MSDNFKTDNVKSCLPFVTLLFCISASGQDIYEPDTVKIREVVITSRRNNNELVVYKVSNASQKVIDDNSLGSVSDILNEISPVFIKSYGPGGIASPTFRGTAAGNTQVLWNGIRIDHPMLGQSDLSLLPAGFADGLSVYYGGASMPMTSGAAGGVISIETKPLWEKISSLSINPAAGSFGRYGGLVSLRKGSESFQSVTKAFFQTADNDFKYINSVSGPVPFSAVRKNNEVSQLGFLQEFYYQRPESNLSAKIWYQDTHRNLPGIILASAEGQGEKQHDESFRSLINYESQKEFADFSLSGAWLNTQLDYYNKVASVDSRNSSNTFIIKGSITKDAGDFAKINILFNESLDEVHSNNYAKNIRRNNAYLKVSFDTREISGISASILVREILDKDRFLKPDFSTGLRFRILETKDYFLKANISRSSKIPTLNDLFWNPGGNPLLRNEYAFMYEVDFSLKENIFTCIDLQYDLSVYKNNIKDMIKWHPGEYSYWTAANIGNVNTRGLESSISLKYERNSFNSNFTAGYSYTRATGFDYGNPDYGDMQLIYVPVHQANGSLRVGYRNIHTTWRSNATGKRFTSADNREYLMPYFVNDLSAGVSHDLSFGTVDISFNIDNLFNAAYQTIAYYPLPGRTWLVKLLIQISK